MFLEATAAYENGIFLFTGLSRPRFCGLQLFSRVVRGDAGLLPSLLLVNPELVLDVNEVSREDTSKSIGWSFSEDESDQVSVLCNLQMRSQSNTVQLSNEKKNLPNFSVPALYKQSNCITFP